MSYALLWGCVALILAVAGGGPLISALKARNVGKAISADGPESHFSKAGTPTMGGLLFLTAGLGVAVVAGVPKDGDVLLPVVLGVITGILGFYDDLGTLVERGTREAHDRKVMLLKLAAFVPLAGVSAWLLYDQMDAPRLLVPHYGEYDIGWFYILVVIAVIVSTTAALGVTDGLDMLAGGTSAVAFAAYGVLALMGGQTGIATFCFAMAGALVGFLWWNAFPARLFMGDLGSLPLGFMLGVVALQTGWWLLLPLIGIIFVAAALSDVIQIGSYRLRGKRVFRMAPLQHHFEKGGMPETQITVRMLVVAIAAAMAAIALAALD